MVSTVGCGIRKTLHLEKEIWKPLTTAEQAVQDGLANPLRSFASLLTAPISGPLAGAHSRFARPLIGLRDDPIELSRLRSRSAYQAQSSRPPSGFAPLARLARKIALKCNFRPQPTAAHLAARYVF